MRNFLIKFFTLIIRAYQVCISPLHKPCCRFYPTCSNYALEALKKHGIINIAKLPGEKIYKTFDDTKEIITDCYVGNDGIAYCASGKIGESPNENLPSTYDGRFSLIYVDVNGVEKGVSTVGKDAFLLYVDYKGAVIPAGSLLFKDYIGEDVKTWKEECNAEEVTGYGEACAGSIIDNGLKVIYKF